MKLAFLILAHRSPEQVIKLVNSLIYEKDVTIFIHVDAKANGVFEVLKNEFRNNPGVVFTPFRYKVYWGSYNQIRATVLLIKTAVQFGKFDYYSLISGQDMPVKPLAEFKEFLSQNCGKEFMIHFKLPDSGNWGECGGLDRLQLFWVDIKIQRYSYSFRKLNKFIHKLQGALRYKRKLKYEFYGGFNWFTLSKEAVSYIVNFLDKNKAYLKRYRYTGCADEIFIQTILMNSPLKENMVNESLRYIDWASGPEYPKIMRMEDFNTLTGSNRVYFARKFDYSVDQKVIDELITFVTKRETV